MDNHTGQGEVAIHIALQGRIILLIHILTGEELAEFKEWVYAGCVTI